MNSYTKLLDAINTKNSMLCIGLDTDIDKMPDSIEKSYKGIIEFNRIVIESSADLCPAYKINTAFYEQYGIKGWEAMEKTVELIPKNCFLIMDAKRGDIGNTSKAYAKCFFETFSADAITVAPYMGEDSVTPFLDYTDKFVFLLALTSNKGSYNFQRLIANEKPLYKHIIETSTNWASKEHLGYVVGATHPEELAALRFENQQRVFLIPGVGSQGGDVDAVLKANNNSTALINVSRDIIYASKDEDFADAIRKKTMHYCSQF